MIGSFFPPFLLVFFTMSSYCLLASVPSEDKSAINIFWVSLYYWIIFLLMLSKDMLFSFVLQLFYSNLSACVSLCLLLLRFIDFLRCMDWILFGCFLIQIWEVLAIIFYISFLLLFLSFHLMIFLCANIDALKSISIFLHFFLLFGWHNLYWSNFKCAESLPVQIYSWVPLIYFFFSCCTFQLQNYNLLLK